MGQGREGIVHTGFNKSLHLSTQDFSFLPDPRHLPH